MCYLYTTKCVTHKASSRIRSVYVHRDGSAILCEAKSESEKPSRRRTNQHIWGAVISYASCVLSLC